ncbi:ATP-binding cassette domain-containing protein, partial [Staphylococcus aureus]
VGLEPEKYKNRKPDELSGGQRQRVGVIRALAADPPVILMDEPFSALDPISREKLQDDLIELQTKIKKTIIFVTHDIQEAMKLGDKICLLNEGHIEQIDTPEGFKNNPQSEFVKQFMGSHLEDDAPCVEENAIIRDLDIMKPIDEVTSMSAYPIVYDNQPIEVLYQHLSESERVIVMQEDSVGQYVIDRKDIFKYLSQKKEVAQHD